MAWTAPKIFLDSSVLTASDMNKYVRDNFMELAPAKATIEGSYFLSDGPNKIVERLMTTDNIVTADWELNDSTGTFAYTDLDTPGPIVTVETGFSAMVIMTMDARNVVDANVGRAWASFSISGATTKGFTSDDNDEALIIGSTPGSSTRASKVVFIEGLTPGENTFRMQYRTTENNTEINYRHMNVIPF